MSSSKRKRCDSNGSQNSTSDPILLESPKKCKVTAAKVDQLGKSSPDVESFESAYIEYLPHPLLNELVLNVLFQYLSLESMKQCRLVCRVWNDEIKPHFKEKAVVDLDMTSQTSGRTAEEFLSLMKNPPNEYPASSLWISGIDFFNCDLRQIFSSFGECLQTLTLDAAAMSSNPEIRLEKKHLILLSQLCPNLQSLNLMDLPDPVIEKGFPKLMKTLRSNCFPNLKSFSFMSHSYSCPLDAQFIMDFMDFAPNLTQLSFSVFDDEAFDEVMAALELRSKFMEQVEVLKFGFDFGNTLFETHIQTLLNLNLNLRHLEINSLGADVSSQTLTWLLENLKPTLERLKLGDVANMVEGPGNGIVLLTFPHDMEKLKHLEINGLGYLRVGSIRFLERIPNLETCILHKTSVFGCIDGPMFWRTLFPSDSKMKGFCHDRLTNLRLPKDLGEVDVIFSLKKYFPALKRLSLNIAGSAMLPGIIEKLKDSKIEELYLRLIPDCINESFDADISGIPAEDCKTMLKERTYWPINPNMDLKVWSSFADWKCLRKLSMISKTHEYYQLNGVSLIHGFAQAKNITSLELGNFSIKDVFILELLNKMPLSALRLVGCNIVRSVWGGANGIQDRVRILFPSVDFVMDFDTPARNIVVEFLESSLDENDGFSSEEIEETEESHTSLSISSDDDSFVGPSREE